MPDAVVKILENDLTKKKLFSLFKIIFSSVLIYFIFNYVSFNEIVQAFVHSDFRIMSLVFALSFVNIYVQFKKWELIAESYLEEHESAKIFKSLMIGFAAGILTPARVGEFAGRAIPFGKNNLLKITIATFLDKIFALAIMFIVGGASLFLLFGQEINLHTGIITLLISLFLLLSFSIIYLIKTGKVRQIKKTKFVKNFLSKFHQLKHLERNIFYKLIIISFIFVLIYLIQFSLLISAFTSSPDYLLFFLVGAAVMFTKTFLLPFGFGDLGVREGAAVYFITLLGFSGAAGFSASILLFTINLLIPSLIGSIYFIKK